MKRLLFHTFSAMWLW